jgi:hypothetical protein
LTDSSQSKKFGIYSLFGIAVVCVWLFVGVVVVDRIEGEDHRDFFKEGPHVQACLLVITIQTTVDLSGSMLKAEEAIQAAVNETGVGTRLNAVLSELPRRPDGADVSDLLPWRFAQRQQPVLAASTTSA